MKGRKKQTEYGAVATTDDAAPITTTTTIIKSRTMLPGAESVLQAIKWPRDAGLFASTTTPDVRPTTADAWFAFFTRARNQPFTHDLVGNLKAGATVACVNVPLSISLALASGGTPTQGMVCALWSSICIGIFGGSQFNVVGTTSALSGMLDKLAIRYGSEVLPTVAVYTSLFLALFWVLRVDKLLRFIATPAALGFATGVGVMIGLGPLSSATGMRGLPAADGFIAKLVQFLSNFARLSPADGVLYVASCVVLFKLAFKWAKIPWVLVLAAVGIALGMVTSAAPPSSGSHPTFFLLREKFPVIDMALVVPGTVLPSWVPFSHAVSTCSDTVKCVDVSAWAMQADVIFYSFGCAVVSLLETLISAMMANRMLKGKCTDSDVLARAYSSSREAVGLAISAFACGLSGGIAPAAALARTSLNVKSGAFSRMSTLINAVVLIIIAFLFMPKFEYLPFACVGAILMLVAYRLIEFDELRAIAKGDPAGAYLCVLTCVCCMFLDTFAGLMIGSVVSIAMNWHVIGTVPLDVRTEHQPGSKRITVEVDGSLMFANRDATDARLEAVLTDIIDSDDTPTTVHLDLARCVAMDYDGMEVVDEWARKIRLTGATLTIDAGLNVTRALSISHHLLPHHEDGDDSPVVVDATPQDH